MRRVLLLVLALAAAACGSDSGATPAPEPEVRIDAATGYHYGSNDWVQWHPGTLPVILSAGHGGSLEPGAIPDRTFGVTVTDLRTREMTLAIEEALIERLGAAPHVVISNLKRTKLDPNRAITEAAQGSPEAETAWRQYHAFIDSASAQVEADHGPGLYLDIHGHGHDIQRVELGYLYSGVILRRTDAQIDDLDGADSSLRALGARTQVSFAELLRGEGSVGGLLEAAGYPSVPSPTWPHPDGEPYFTGGYSTARHGSSQGGQVDGIQFELNWEGVRNSAANREAFATALADVVATWLETHY
jgi:N-formylglutamate amidohydrolase